VGVTKIRGVIPPIVTPMHPDGRIDVESLRRLVAFQIDAGVDALFTLGTGGEGPWLTAESRRIVLETVASAVGGRVPVLAGVSDVGTARAIEAIRDAEATGCDAVVATPAFYGDNGQAEILAHFRALAQATDLPLIAYDIPSKVHVKIGAQTAATLAHEGTIVAIKDSSGDEDGFRAVIDLTADLDSFSVITGSDVIADAALFQGGDGLIVGMGNIDPHGFVALYRHCVAGDWGQARQQQTKLRAMRQITQVALPRIGGFSATIGAFKAALVERNVIAHDTMHLPLLTLTDAEKQAVSDILAGLGIKPAYEPAA
jgi:4-hydroxy-tetrahydrodipicolinate synthase